MSNSSGRHKSHVTETLHLFVDEPFNLSHGNVGPEPDYLADPHYFAIQDFGYPVAWHSADEIEAFDHVPVTHKWYPIFPDHNIARAHFFNSFAQHVPPRIRDLHNQDRVRITLYNVSEPFLMNAHSAPEMFSLMKAAYGLDTDKVLHICGDLCCRSFRSTRAPHDHMPRVYGIDALRYAFLDIRAMRDAHGPQHAPLAPRHFLSFNNKWRPHRALLMATLPPALMEKGYVSFRFAGMNGVSAFDTFSGFEPEALIDVVTETLASEEDFSSQKQFFFFPTEKIWKPMLRGQPFLVIGTQGFLSRLRDRGFETFPELFDEGYDMRSNWRNRTRDVIGQLEAFCAMDYETAKAAVAKVADKIAHNRALLLNDNRRSEFERLMQQIAEDE